MNKVTVTLTEDQANLLLNIVSGTVADLKELDQDYYSKTIAFHKRLFHILVKQITKS